MTLRYLFLCPAQRVPSGGVAVVYDCVQELISAGYSAAVLHEFPSFRYDNTPHRPPILSTTILRRKNYFFDLSLQHPRRTLNSITTGLDLLRSRVAKPADDLAEFGPNDVIVVPDVFVDHAARAVPFQPKVLFSQNSFLHLKACQRAIAAGCDPNAGLVWAIGINETSLDAIHAIVDCPASKIDVCPNLSLFEFAATKRRQIAYMPRKRPEEAALIDHLLRKRGKLAGFDLVAVDGLPQMEVARILSESLVFVSLMREEALGFPAIEAMASGCVVVGYTGLGTQEYFDTTTGIPITEGDTVGLVSAVEAIVAEYSESPARLDALRQTASKTVRQRFSRERFKGSLLEAWEAIDATLSGRTTTSGLTRQTMG